jgi:hypothetical protein
MAKQSLEERVAALERQVAELQTAVDKAVGNKNWLSTVGMFSGDEVMKRIDEGGRKWRESDRRKARPKQVNNRKRKP